MLSNLWQLKKKCKFTKIKTSHSAMKLPNSVLNGIVILLLLASCQETVVDLPSQTSVFFYPKVGTEKEHEYCALKDGGYAVCGNIEEAAYLFVLDEDGSERFYTTVNGEAFDEFRFVIETSDGNLLAVGTTTSQDLGSAGPYTTMAALYDKNGNQIWQQTFPKAYHTLANNAIELSDGSFVLMGEFQNPADGNSDLIFQRITSDGSEVYERHYGLAQGGHSVWGSAIGSNGELLISSQTAPIYQPYFFGRFAISLMALDPLSGDSLWATRFDKYLKEDDNARYGQLRQTIIPLDNGYVIGQLYEDSSNKVSAQLLSVDLDGNEIWETKLYGTSTFNFEGLHMTEDGGFLVSGRCEDKSAVIKTDQFGKQEWINFTGGESKVQTAFQAYDKNGEIYVLGRLWKAGSGVGQYMLYKLDYEGAIIKD